MKTIKFEFSLSDLILCCNDLNNAAEELERDSEERSALSATLTDMARDRRRLAEKLNKAFDNHIAHLNTVFIPVKPLTKEQIDVQLIEACVLEKWNPRAMGYKVKGWSGVSSCVLCQMYYKEGNRCEGCPVSKKSGQPLCHGTPFDKYMEFFNCPEEYDAIEAEIEFLISCLPENHPWRN